MSNQDPSPMNPNQVQFELQGDGETKEARDKVLTYGLLMLLTGGAVLFLGDTLLSYELGPRGTDVGLINAHTAVVLACIVFAGLTLYHLVQYLSKR